MKRTVTRYDLAQDCFTNLCYLYDYGCCCMLDQWRTICVIVCPQGESRGLRTLYDLETNLNLSPSAWMAEEIEIED